MTTPAASPSDPRLDDLGFVAGRTGPMLPLVLDFPNQFAAPVLIHGAAPARSASETLWVAAMGGSAFAGDMLAAALASFTDVRVVRGYALPAAAGTQDRVLALSYSGNTSETLSVFDEAVRRGLTTSAVTSGGELAGRARERQIPWAELEAGYPPRAAAGLLWSASVQLMSAAGERTVARSDGAPSIDPKGIDRNLKRCRTLWGPEAPGNEAKRIASRFLGRLPIVYAAAAAEPALLRWRTQLNENAKVLCHTASLPEMNHNEVVGWTEPSDWREAASVLFLRAGFEDHGSARRLEITREWLESRGVPTLTASAQGETPIERLWWLCHLSDYVSVYLAALRGCDPTPVTAIDELKRRLAEDNL